MVCDLAAFSASVYMRGCRSILVPTSLLAMVDASIGGKTGFNFLGYKNMIGTFYPAELVVMSLEALKTLPEREYKAGLAEVIKTAMLGDAGLFKLLAVNRKEVLARDPDLLEEIIHRSISVKAGIVEEDFRERGKRAILNLGHTFAHALEAVTGLEVWNHGEAVAWGLARALELGVRIGVTGKDYADSVIKLLADYEFRLEAGSVIGGNRRNNLMPLKTSAIIRAMYADKKKREGKLRLVLQRGICETCIEFVGDKLVAEVLRKEMR